MKKLSVLLCLLWVILACYGQHESKSAFKGGVRAGVTLTQISGDGLSGFHKLGAYAGLYASVPMTPDENWRFQMEIDFAMKGSRNYTPPKHTVNPMQKYVLNIGYVEVPFLFKWRFGNNIRICNNKNGIDTCRTINGQFEIEFGPMFGVNLYQRERDYTGIIPFTESRIFRRFEFSGMAGLSYFFANHHGISLRYSNSIIPVRIPNWTYNERIWKQFNSVIMVSYFYQF